VVLVESVVRDALGMSELLMAGRREFGCSGAGQIIGNESSCQFRAAIMFLTPIRSITL
jgi:hypothetical protein